MSFLFPFPHAHGHGRYKTHHQHNPIQQTFQQHAHFLPKHHSKDLEQLEQKDTMQIGTHRKTEPLPQTLPELVQAPQPPKPNILKNPTNWKKGASIMEKLRQADPAIPKQSPSSS